MPSRSRASWGDAHGCRLTPAWETWEWGALFLLRLEEKETGPWMQVGWTRVLTTASSGVDSQIVTEHKRFFTQKFILSEAWRGREIATMGLGFCPHDGDQLPEEGWAMERVPFDGRKGWLVVY